MAERPTSAQSDLDPIVTLEGVVERIVYESEETGFIVGRLRVEGDVDLNTFVGSVMAISPGETVKLRGRWIEDKRFGKQLRIETCESILPATVDGIEKYLGSGLIDGIGPEFSKRLVNAFGVETLRVIKEQPKRLRSVPGIGKKRAAQIQESWASQQAIQSIMLFLQGHGITTSQAIKIYKHYGDGALAVLRENPYRLAEDIAGIGFRSADKIAQELGIDKAARTRLQAGLLHVLRQGMLEGHCFLPASGLRGAAVELLDVAEDSIAEALRLLFESKQAVRECAPSDTSGVEDAVFLPTMHQAERGVAKQLKRLIAALSENVPIQIDKALEWVAKSHAIELSPEQSDAIRTGVKAKVMVITGGPGTGKTTVINSLLAILEKKGVSFLLAAPTGRAAKRMEAATDREARTIHRLLEFSPKHGAFAQNEHNPLTTDLLIVDEASMIDIALMHDLLKALPPFARLILVGDVDQLPSVGPGNVLLDTIASGEVPVVRLKTVFRQAAESGIITGAQQINQGKYPAFNTTDFFLIERHEPNTACETIIELLTKRIPAKFGLDPRRDIQVLSPMRRGEAGVEHLNEALQAALNPNGEPVARRTLRSGDKVMQLRNNYELDVYNGDVGIITLLDVDAKELEVTFDDGRVVLYAFDQLDDLGLAYAATIHKSQGSEYPMVVLAFLPQHYMMLQRNVLYTAITRGKNHVIVVGDAKAVGMAVRNSKIVLRNTRLAERLRNVL